MRTDLVCDFLQHMPASQQLKKSPPWLEQAHQFTTETSATGSGKLAAAAAVVAAAVVAAVSGPENLLRENSKQLTLHSWYIQLLLLVVVLAVLLRI